MALLVLILTVFCTSIKAQSITPTVDWAISTNQVGIFSTNGQSEMVVNRMAHDAAGNVYVAGLFIDTINFNPAGSDVIGTISAGGYLSYDGFIAKYSASGLYQWAVRLGSPNSQGLDAVYDIAVDADGNVYAAGRITTNGFVRKFSTDGSTLWTIPLGGNCDVNGIALDESNNVLVTGKYSGTIDMNPGIGENFLSGAGGNWNAFVAKYTADGTYQWAFGLGSVDGGDYGFGITTGATDNVIVTGRFSNTVNFDPAGAAGGASLTGTSTNFLASYSSAGEYQWAFKLGDNTADHAGYYIATDASGNVLISGDFGVTVDFDPGINPVQLDPVNGDVFVAKYSQSGAYSWAFQNTADAFNLIHGIVVDGSDNVLITGLFTGTMDFDPGSGTSNLISYGQGDAFVAKYTSSGAYQWAFQIGDASFDNGRAVDLDNTGKVCAAGMYNGNVNFGSGITQTHPGQNMFVAKYTEFVAPSVTISSNPPSPVCANTSVTFTAIPIHGGATPTYQWKKNNVNIPGATNAIYVDSLLVNNNQITCEMTSDLLNALPATVISNALTLVVMPMTTLNTPGAITVTGGNSKVCPGDVRTYSINSVANSSSYTWTAPTGGIITSGQGTTSVQVSYGAGFTANGIISVVALNACGSSLPRNLTVSRNTPATPSIISGPAVNVCAPTTQSYSVTAVTGITYQWTAPANATITAGQGINSVVIDFGASFISGNLLVKAQNSCGISNARTLAVASVPPKPGVISVDITGAICPAATRTYTIAPVANSSGYLWTVPAGSTILSGQGTTSITVEYTLNFVGSGTVAVKSQSVCGLSAARSLSVSRNTPSNPFPIQPVPFTEGWTYSPYLVCPGETRHYYVDWSSNTQNYIWTVPVGAQIIEQTSGYITDQYGYSLLSSIVTVEFTSGFTANGTLSVYGINECGAGAAATKTITRNVPVMYSSNNISGPANGVCAGSTKAYSVYTDSNADGYQWTAPANATIISGQGTENVTITFGASFTAGTLSVKPFNDCGLGTGKSLAIKSKPSTPGTITGPTTGVCTSTRTYSIAPVVGATSYVWSSSISGATFSSSGTTASVTWPQFTTGTLYVRAQNACGQSSARSLAVKGYPVFPNSGVSFSSPDGVCPNTTHTLSCGTIFGATSYTWNVSGGATVVSGQGTNTVDIHFGSGSSGISVIQQNNCGSAAPMNWTVTVADWSSCRVEEETIATMSLYPNPTSSSVTITLPAFTNAATLRLVNVLGQTLQSVDLNDAEQPLDTELNFDVSGFAAGIYQAVLETENGLETLRFVKQ